MLPLLSILPMDNVALGSWPKAKVADAYIYNKHSCSYYKLDDKNVKMAFGSFFDDL